MKGGAKKDNILEFGCSYGFSEGRKVFGISNWAEGEGGSEMLFGAMACVYEGFFGDGPGWERKFKVMTTWNG